MAAGRRLFVLLAAMFLVAATPADAWAGKKKVDWTAVEARAGDDSKRVTRRLRQLLVEASKQADWGKGPTLELRARITELEWERLDDVVRLRLTVVGRIVGGATARSHLRLGTHPSERSKLERQALRIVAEGLVTRLAEIARKRPTS